MPAKRLPWFKMWVGCTAHPKVATLEDATFRTWVELLDAASQQPTRGAFGSLREAAAVIRRPIKQIQAVIDAGLLDETPRGLVMHDWSNWQRWQADEDANDAPTSPDEPPKNTRSTHEEHTNGYTNDTPPLQKKREERRETVDEETRDDSAPDGAGRAAVAAAPPTLHLVPRIEPQPVAKPTPKPTPVGTFLDAVKALDPTVAVAGDRAFFGTRLKQNPDADLALMAEAYVSWHHGEWPGSPKLSQTGDPVWLIGDVGAFAIWKRNGGRNAPVPMAKASNPAVTDWIRSLEVG